MRCGAGRRRGAALAHAHRAGPRPRRAADHRDQRPAGRRLRAGDDEPRPGPQRVPRRRRPGRRRLPGALRGRGVACIRAITAPRPGVLAALDVEGVRRSPGVAEVLVDTAVGQRVGPARANGDRLGFLIAAGRPPPPSPERPRRRSPARWCA
ncbi:hypothetical protein ACFQ2B_32345 [Streptomyces stramineus]